MLGKELRITPATGGAIEDLQHPDQDKAANVTLNISHQAKLNGDVERSYRTHTGEFYTMIENSFDIDKLRDELLGRDKYIIY